MLDVLIFFCSLEFLQGGIRINIFRFFINKIRFFFKLKLFQLFCHQTIGSRSGSRLTKKADPDPNSMNRQNLLQELFAAQYGCSKPCSFTVVQYFVAWATCVLRVPLRHVRYRFHILLQGNLSRCKDCFSVTNPGSGILCLFDPWLRDG